MIKLFGFIVSISLIGIIFLYVPQESLGLSSFATKSSARRLLNILIAIGVLIYFGIAVKLNLLNN